MHNTHDTIQSMIRRREIYSDPTLGEFRVDREAALKLPSSLERNEVDGGDPILSRGTLDKIMQASGGSLAQMESTIMEKPQTDLQAVTDIATISKDQHIIEP